MDYYYFAYGSNMQRKRIEDRVGPVSLVGNVVLENYEVKFSKKGMDSSGKANVHDKVDSICYGVLYRLTEEQILILDGYEGTPLHYTRRTIPVKSLDNGATYNGEIYIATSETITLPGLKPTAEYLSYIVNGGIENNFPSDFYCKLKESLHFWLDDDLISVLEKNSLESCLKN